MHILPLYRRLHLILLTLCIQYFSCSVSCHTHAMLSGSNTVAIHVLFHSPSFSFVVCFELFGKELTSIHLPLLSAPLCSSFEAMRSINKK